MNKLEIMCAGFPFNRLYWILTVLHVISQISSLSISKNYNINGEPEILLIGYAKEDSVEVTTAEDEFRSRRSYQNDFISKDGHDFVIYPQTKSIVLSCEAEYPITWKFPFPKQLGSPMDRDINALEYRISDFGQDDTTPVNTRFKLFMGIHFTSVFFFSTNVTCISSEYLPESQASVHIYVADKSCLEYEGQTLQLPVRVDQTSNAKMRNLPPLILPCRPTSPKLKLFLEKEYTKSSLVNGTLQQNKMWVPSRLASNHLSFDPKIGFSLDRNLLGDEIFGLYRCSVIYVDEEGGEELDSEKFVLVNVTKIIINGSIIDATNMANVFEPRQSKQPKASVRIAAPFLKSRFPPSSIQCCSGIAGKRPKLYMGYCMNPITCDIKKKIMMDDLAAGTGDEIRLRSTYNIPKDCIKGYFALSSTLVMCKAETVDFVQQFVNLFRAEANGPMKGRFDRAHQDYPLYGTRRDPRVMTLSTYQSQYSQNASGINQRMAVMVGYIFRKNESTLLRRWRASIRFPAVYDDPIEIAADDGLKALTRLLGPLKPDSGILLQEYDRDVYYEGEMLTLMCFGVRFFYAEGPKIRINWKNGTRTNVEPIPYSGTKETIHLYLSGNAVMFDEFGGDLVPVFGREIVANQEMSSVDCWMPKRSSSEWDKISKSLKVRQSVAPRFLQKLDETVYFYLGDAEHVLNCTVNDGYPFPNFKVTRDGKQLPITYIEGENATREIREHNWKNGTEETETIDMDKHLINLNINFSNITHDHQSVWRCIASNINGTVTRTIRVFVIERRGIALPISLGFAAVMCLAIIGLGLKRLHNKQILKSRPK